MTKDSGGDTFQKNSRRSHFLWSSSLSLSLTIGNKPTFERKHLAFQIAGVTLLVGESGAIRLNGSSTGLCVLGTGTRFASLILHPAREPHKILSYLEDGDLPTPGIISLQSTTLLLTMIAPAAFRMAGRRLATTGSRRVFSATAANAVKNDNARMALMVTAGLSLAVASLQQREVRKNWSIESKQWSLCSHGRDMYISCHNLPGNSNNTGINSYTSIGKDPQSFWRKQG